MKNKSTVFYADCGQIDKSNIKSLFDLIDDGTYVVHIRTPKNWKCKRKGCKTSFKHTHATYSSLSDKNVK